MLTIIAKRSEKCTVNGRKTSVEQIQVVEFSAQVASRITFSAERQPQQLMHTYEKLCIVIKRFKGTVTP